MGDPFTKEITEATNLSRPLREEVQTTELMISGIRCVIYTPTLAEAKVPAIIYMHGGGFVVGCSEDTDYITRKLCWSNQMVVVSVNYRLAPETAFPGALQDCDEVLKVVIRDYEKLSIDPERLYLAGDSAGANLALGCFHRLEDSRSRIKALILLAPWLDMEVEKYDSYNRLAPDGLVFDAPFIAYARAAYTGFEEWKNPMVSPIHTMLKDPPPTFIAIGTEDPFLDQVNAFERKAKLDGCRQLEVRTYAGMPHCFYSFENLYREESECFERISEFIKRP